MLVPEAGVGEVQVLRAVVAGAAARWWCEVGLLPVAAADGVAWQWCDVGLLRVVSASAVTRRWWEVLCAGAWVRCLVV
ncbi:hypothetical protein SAMN05216174_12273 [Actinokineospora iranica]|uniref:Uncharacterized protein n=1 Tax=Actinokineospora iranica TaxID=1271860 RepID=A0A1G6YNS1_9PSEU|nr:hypothetical protein SAMN05216174_12273 [Actinokineospora iranica]